MLCVFVIIRSGREDTGDDLAMTILLKLLGTGLMGIAGFAIGSEKSRSLWIQKTFWDELYRMLCQIRDEIHFRAIPLPQLLSELQQQHQYPHLGLESCNAFQNFHFPEYIPVDQTTVFKTLFKSLGQTTSQELCEQMNYYTHLCQQHKEALAEEYTAANKLYPKAGVCGGFLMALLLF